MSIYTPTLRCSSRAGNPHHDRRHRADFARQAVIAAFGRHARALDQADFIDRQPGDVRRVR